MKALSVLLAVVSMIQFSTVSFAANSAKSAIPATQEVEFILPVSSEDAQNNFENFASAKIDLSASKGRNDVKVATIVGQVGNTSYTTKTEVYNVSRSSSHDIVEGTSPIASSTSGSLPVSLVTNKEYLIKVTCTSSSSMTGMLKVKCNAANHTAGLGIASQSKYDYFIVGVVEKVFKFTPTTSGTYTIQTNKPGTTSVDTYLELRNSGFSVLAQDDDSGDGLYSSISYSLTQGTTYYIVVTSYSHHANAANGSNMQCGLRISKE